MPELLTDMLTSGFIFMFTCPATMKFVFIIVKYRNTKHAAATQSALMRLASDDAFAGNVFMNTGFSTT